MELFLSEEAPPYRACAWRYLVQGGVTVHRISREHDELLSRKHVHELATILQSALHRAQTQNSKC